MKKKNSDALWIRTCDHLKNVSADNSHRRNRLRHISISEIINLLLNIQHLSIYRSIHGY